MGLNADIVQATKKGELAKVMRLYEQGADVNTRVGDSIKKRSILHHAAQRGFLDIVRYLLGCNMPVDLTDADEKTPLYYAVEEAKVDVVKELVKHQATINILGRGNPFIRACECSYDSCDIVEFLLESGADINALCDINETPLYGALRQGNIAATRLLLTLGADINHRDLGGTTPAMSIAYHDRTSNLRLLLDKGAELNAAGYHDGNTALHIAAIYGRKSVVSVLLEYGGKADVLNRNGLSPLDIARKVGKKNVVDALTQLSV